MEIERYRHTLPLNSLPHCKIVDWSKLNAFTNKKIHVTKTIKFVSGRVEKIMGKGENAGNQHFLHFPCFQKLFLPGC